MRLLPCALAMLSSFSPVLAQRSDAPRAASGERPPTAPDPARARRGAIVFDRFCVSCHGVHGDGRGYSSPNLDPAPRDFTRGIFKWRSTPSESLPTNEDLIRTVSRGLNHTNMPSWAPLGDRAVRDVVEYVKTFSPRWARESPGKPIQIGAEPPDTPQSRRRGGELYTEMGCFNCHGEKGKGDGPSMPTLLDDWGHKIVPFDFSGGTKLKCGDRGEDVYRVLQTGLTGSPMPSYADQLSPEDTWNLVHYLQVLRAD